MAIGEHSFKYYSYFQKLAERPLCLPRRQLKTGKSPKKAGKTRGRYVVTTVITFCFPFLLGARLALFHTTFSNCKRTAMRCDVIISGAFCLERDGTKFDRMSTIPLLMLNVLPLTDVEVLPVLARVRKKVAQRRQTETEAFGVCTLIDSRLLVGCYCTCL